MTRQSLLLLRLFSEIPPFIFPHSKPFTHTLSINHRPQIKISTNKFSLHRSLCLLQPPSPSPTKIAITSTSQHHPFHPNLTNNSPASQIIVFNLPNLQPQLQLHLKPSQLQLQPHLQPSHLQLPPSNYAHIPLQQPLTPPPYTPPYPPPSNLSTINSSTNSIPPSKQQK